MPPQKPANTGPFSLPPALGCHGSCSVPTPPAGLGEWFPRPPSSAALLPPSCLGLSQGQAPRGRQARRGRRCHPLFQEKSRGAKRAGLHEDRPSMQWGVGALSAPEGEGATDKRGHSCLRTSHRKGNQVVAAMCPGRECANQCSRTETSSQTPGRGWDAAKSRKELAGQGGNTAPRFRHFLGSGNKSRSVVSCAAERQE